MNNKSRQPEATPVSTPPPTTKKEKEIPHVIKVRKLETIYSVDAGNSSTTSVTTEKQDSTASRIPAPVKKSENSISRLIKAFEDKKERTRLESTDDKNNSTLQLSETGPNTTPKQLTSAGKKPAPLVPPSAIKTVEPKVEEPADDDEYDEEDNETSEIIDRQRSIENGKKEEAAANLEKEFQNRISKLIKKFEPTGEGEMDVSLNGTQIINPSVEVKSEKMISVRNGRSKDDDDDGEVDDTTEEIESSLKINDSIVASSSSVVAPTKNKKKNGVVVGKNGDVDLKVSVGGRNNFDERYGY